VTTRTRALEVDLLRILAIAAMVTLHVLGSWWMLARPGALPKQVAVLIHDACQMCVPVLLLLSFFLLAQQQPGAGAGTVLRWMGSRLRSLLPPTVVWAVLYALLAGWLHARGWWASWFMRFWLGPLGSLPETAVHLWYMFVLLQWVPFLPLALWGVNRLTAGQPLRAQVLLGTCLILKRIFCGYVFRPGAAGGLADWVGLLGPFWLDLFLFAVIWHIPGALRPEGSQRLARWAWLGLLVLALASNFGEVRRLSAMGAPEMLAHSNWRFGNSLYGITVFAAFLTWREPLLGLVPERLARVLQHFNQEYSFAFYLAHVLPLTLAGNLVRVLRPGPAASLFLLVGMTVTGTLGLLWLLRRTPLIGAWVGLRPSPRYAE
jgi:surface polysaccharide O-acyltransferase-like enzyme